MKKRSAFTMIELVMVIVVFGIVASIGAEIVASLYNNYLRTRAINRLQSQTEIVLEQIAKRLQYRIKDSVRANNNNGAAGSWVALPSAVPGYNIIEWIGISNESFLGEWNGATAVVPGWSGLIDMNDINTSHANRTLATPGSRLDFTNSIIRALTNDTVAMDATAGAKRPALIFKGSKPGTFSNYYENATNIANNPYARRVHCVNNNCAANLSMLQLNSNAANDDLIDYNLDTFGDLFEQYYLSHTAYALVPVGNANDFNLTLVYNYQPWEGDTYANGTSALLAEHVSTFRIRQDDSVVRIKLCIHDNNQSGSFDFSACKEKVIY